MFEQLHGAHLRHSGLLGHDRILVMALFPVNA
jgi:hypothetical protein